MIAGGVSVSSRRDGRDSAVIARASSRENAEVALEHPDLKERGVQEVTRTCIGSSSSSSSNNNT